MLKQLFKRGFVVFDCETTGIDPMTSEIIQIGIVSSDGETLLNTFVRPVYEINENSQAFAVNGITQAMVEDAPTLAELWPKIERIIWDTQVLAWNAQFDFNMLCCGLQRAEIEHMIRSWRCAMGMYIRAARIDRPRYSLASACLHLGVEQFDAHSAIGDAFSTLAVLQAMRGNK